VGNFTTLSVFRLYIVERQDEWWIGKDFEGSGRDVSEVLSRHLPRSTLETEPIRDNGRIAYVRLHTVTATNIRILFSQILFNMIFWTILLINLEPLSNTSWQLSCIAWKLHFWILKTSSLCISHITFRDPSDRSIGGHSGRAVYGMKCLRPLEHWGRGFESR
jgi:hypothetical protein